MSHNISVIFDLQKDDEMNYIKNMALDLLNRATVFDPKTHKLVNADYRVSKTAWLRDDPIVEKLNRRISIISGVDHEYAEDMQMSNYGIGGQYEPHYDFRKSLPYHIDNTVWSTSNESCHMSHMI